MSLELKDSAFDPDDPSSRRIEHRKLNPKGDILYRVFLYLDGRRLPFVSEVVYELHETFPNRIRRVRRSPSNPHCKLEIWTWGTFEVQASVRSKDRQAGLTLTHWLRFPEDFEDQGAKFVEVGRGR